MRSLALGLGLVLQDILEIIQKVEFVRLRFRLLLLDQLRLLLRRLFFLWLRLFRLFLGLGLGVFDDRLFFGCFGFARLVHFFRFFRRILDDFGVFLDRVRLLFRFGLFRLLFGRLLHFLDRRNVRNQTNIDNVDRHINRAGALRQAQQDIDR